MMVNRWRGWAPGGVLKESDEVALRLPGRGHAGGALEAEIVLKPGSISRNETSWKGASGMRSSGGLLVTTDIRRAKVPGRNDGCLLKSAGGGRASYAAALVASALREPFLRWDYGQSALVRALQG